MTDLIQRLRESAKAARALDRSALLVEAADELERCRILFQWMVICGVTPVPEKRKRKKKAKKR